MPTVNLKSKDADPSLFSYDKSSADVHFTVPLKTDNNGHAYGTTHMSGKDLLHALGQPNADMLGIKRIDVPSISTNSDFPLTGSFSTGKKDSADDRVIATASRVHTVDANGNSRAGHFHVPSRGRDGQPIVVPPKGFGSIDIDLPAAHKEHVTTAVGRDLRWANEMLQTPDQLASTCKEVNSNNATGALPEETRFLVPTEITDASCAMSKLFSANKSHPQFCDGSYLDANRQTVDVDGKDMLIVDPDHFKSVGELLASNLKTHSPFKDGISVTLRSLGPQTVSPGEEVTVHTTIGRASLNEVFGEPHAEGKTLTRADAHVLIGEDPEMVPMLVGAPSRVNQLATNVFAKKLGRRPGVVLPPSAVSSVRTAEVTPHVVKPVPVPSDASRGTAEVTPIQ